MDFWGGCPKLIGRVAIFGTRALISARDGDRGLAIYRRPPVHLLVHRVLSDSPPIQYGLCGSQGYCLLRADNGPPLIPVPSTLWLVATRNPLQDRE